LGLTDSEQRGLKSPITAGLLAALKRRSSSSTLASTLSFSRGEEPGNDHRTCFLFFVLLPVFAFSGLRV